jgi:hypothetical protein
LKLYSEILLSHKEKVQPYYTKFGNTSFNLFENSK